MANNFFLNQDPLLYQVRQNGGDEETRRQLSDALIQYQQLQQRNGQAPQTDYIAELDGIVSGISDDVKDRLNNDPEYVRLSAELQTIINREIMWSIKGRINSNQDAVRNMVRQKEMIKDAKEKVEGEQRRNLSELNDYVKNYPTITFEEYKRIKSEETNAGNKKTNNKKEDRK